MIAGYFYDSDIGNYYYGQGHPMKPHRIRMAHNLLLNYGLYKKMEIYRPAPASFEEMAKFHSEEYLTFLRAINPDNVSEYQKQMTVRAPALVGRTCERSLVLGALAFRSASMWARTARSSTACTPSARRARAARSAAPSS